MKPNIEASVLEFLPLAYHIYINNQIDEFLDKLNSSITMCVLLNSIRIIDSPTNSGCKNYAHRGLICRLFSSSAIRVKDNSYAVYTCKDIKIQDPEKFSLAIRNLNENINAPIAEEWVSKLLEIDDTMGGDYNPINKSIEKAIMKVAYCFDNQPQNFKYHAV
ncbi:MAG: hypothetical protein JEZ09_00965 [Salinivirgaceae bacterium]|nr:hypothetical protein [Salinivirgaceae bacterium]